MIDLIDFDLVVCTYMYVLWLPKTNHTESDIFIQGYRSISILYRIVNKIKSKKLK